MGGNILNEKAITLDEWNSISDALYYVRKSHNALYQTDEERLKNMELYLNVAIGLCGAIRKRWEQ